MYYKPICKAHDYKISIKKMGEKFCDLTLGKNFLNATPKV